LIPKGDVKKYISTNGLSTIKAIVMGSILAEIIRCPVTVRNGNRTRYEKGNKQMYQN
jgi:hypothetical protein